MYDSLNYEPLRNMGYMLTRLRAEMLAATDGELAADQRLAHLRVSSTQSAIIALLALGRATSASDLCRAMSYDTGAMARMIGRLESKGLIRRNRCHHDRRRITLELTEEGKAMFPKMHEISMRVTNRFLRTFTDAEARQLEMFLGRALESV
ncbi:MAG: winged helix DNA-binding protein [Gammaproteobacteria bacterium]|nr:MAG: winged helix DNA-binding protein [Gammaproteobacteria bacterium]